MAPRASLGSSGPGQPRRSARRVKRLRGGFNTTLSVFLAFVIAIGTTPVQGTYAYFTNTQNVADNLFTSDTLQPPTTASAQLAGSAINVLWSGSTSAYASGYLIERHNGTSWSDAG